MTRAWRPPNWRDTRVYAPILAGGRAALAWELLRRDPAYRAAAASAGMDGPIDARWGLHFRG